MLSKVLIPLNLHESPSLVIEMADYLSSINTKEFILFHAGSGKGRAAANIKKRFANYTELFKEKNYNFETVLRPGSLTENIFRISDELEIDYIALPFKRKNLFRRLIFGSHIKNVIRLSDMPVMVFKSSGYIQNRDENFNLMFAASLKGNNDKIVPYIKFIEKETDTLTIINSSKRAPDPITEEKRTKEVQKRLLNILESCRIEPDKGYTVLELGPPRKILPKQVRKLSIDLLIMGKSDDISGREPVFGSTAETASYKASCSSLIIPKAEAD